MAPAPAKMIMQARNVRSNATGRAESNRPGFRDVLFGNKPFNFFYFAMYYVVYLWKFLQK